jgi:type III restriction enzyme
MAKATLNDTLDAALKFGGPDFYKSRVPDYIYSNLRNGYGKRPYQQEAFGRFIFYLNEYHERPKGVPTQLLYHMATGSGKTLIMAGLIINLYEKGYRNFLFFVNSTNIIDKTRDNFFNTASSKYLFSDTISIGDKQIRMKEVENFQAANQDDINIVFSTIQGLHSRLNTPKENSLTYDDFEDKKIVLISDEAHHINAETKKGNELGAEEKEEIISWEGTVKRIFYANRNNILLEFTATADLSMPEIEVKYNDKLIYDYPLKQFRKDGYSKEVKVLQADLLPFDRALQGVLLSQYRRKVFEKYKKPIKPVILFKSKTIKESQSFFIEFATGIKNLKVSDLQKIIKAKPDEAIQKVFQYLDANNISFENLITELKEDFSEEKLISVNSKDESEQKQLAVNSLEDEENEYRAVFAVDKLNEGWDVLNLFDIVRLYDTRDAKDGKPGKTTMSEAQLIGRGARYCPFQITEEHSPFTRKFDTDLDNEMRICEELYYHSAYNPRYIDELNTALEEIGIKAKETKEVDLKLKESFKQTPFYKTGFVFINEQKKYDRSDVFSLSSTHINKKHQVSLKTGYTKTTVVFEKQSITNIERKQKDYNLISFGIPVIRKAINKLEFYQFNNLKKHLPNLNSVSEFITSTDYLGNVKIEIEGTKEQLANLSPQEKLDATIKVLQDIAQVIESDKIEFKGTKEFKPHMIKEKFKDKKLNIAISDSKDKEYGIGQSETKNEDLRIDLSQKDWFVFNDNYGTSEEKYLVKFINKTYDKLKSKFSEIYLLRNERHFKIYNFDDGRPLEPDFLLFLTDKRKKVSLHYQIFIEPKGQHLFEHDEWKEKFLNVLKTDHLVEQLWKNKEYTIWGMPFYNEQHRKQLFEEEFEKLFNE